jgi:hypothetical protein
MCMAVRRVAGQALSPSHWEGWDATTQGLHREDRLALYSHMYEVTYRPGEQIIRAGELGRNFYLVVEGVASRLPPKSPTKAHMQV